MRAYILTLALLAAFLTAGNVRVVPDRAEETIVEFWLFGSVTASGFCANFDYMSAGSSCAGQRARYVVSDAWTITRATVSTGTSSWLTIEACDVHIDVAAASIGFFQVGKPALDAFGNVETTTTFSSNTISAGDALQVRHVDPVDDTYCNDGESCACAGASAQYTVRVYGIRT